MLFKPHEIDMMFQIHIEFDSDTIKKTIELNFALYFDATAAGICLLIRTTLFSLVVIYLAFSLSLSLSFSI